MSEKKIVEMEYVPISKVWNKEDKDFTPWLEEHIDFLNKVLDFEIEIEQKEAKQKEGFHVDLLGKDRDDNVIIIENQYNPSDHRHLGQLLVYSITLEAKIGIWICEKARQSHIEVIEWLNENSPEEMGFYLIQIKAGKLKADNMEEIYTPIFEVIVRPSEESKLIGNVKKQNLENKQFCFEFWEEFIKYSSKTTKLFSHRVPNKNPYIDVGVFNIGGIAISPNFTRKELRNEIYINRKKEENKDIYDKIFKLKEHIEEDLSELLKNYNAVLEWDRLDEKKASRIRITIKEYNCYDKKNWDYTFEFLTQSSILLEEVFTTVFKKI